MQPDQDSNGLRQQLGIFPVTNIVIANMIGAGIFTTSGLLMAQLPNPLLMIALWFAGGIIALCGALCYGELGAGFPAAGSEYLLTAGMSFQAGDDESNPHLAFSNSGAKVFIVD